MRKPVAVFLTGQGFLCLGDALFLTITTLKVFQITGSGILTGIGMLSAFIPSVIVSPFSGLLGDIIDEKKMMVITDVIRAGISALFLLAMDLAGFFLLIILSSILDAVYNPPRRKLILNLVERNDVIDLVSLMGFISGAIFFAAPVLTGLVIDTAGTDILFLSRSVIFLVSAVLTVFTAKKGMPLPPVPHKKTTLASILKIRRASVVGSLKMAFRFLDYKTRSGIAALSMVIMGFTGLCSNIAFYWLVFDRLTVSPGQWGLILSTYFGSGALASLLLISVKNRLPADTLKTGLVTVPLFSSVWLVYMFITAWNATAIYPLVFIEGFTSTVFGICALTSLQVNTKTDCMSRVSGIVDFLTGLAKISAVAVSGVLTAVDPVYLFPAAACLNIIYLIFTAGRLSACNGRNRSLPVRHPHGA